MLLMLFRLVAPMNHSAYILDLSQRILFSGKARSWIKLSMLVLSMLIVAKPSFASSLNEIAFEPKVQLTLDALNLPFLNRLEVLRTQGEVGWSNLKEIIFSSQAPYTAKWNAITILPYLRKDESREILLICLKRKEWYYRSSALLALSRTSRTDALQWAEQLLRDSALVVRSQAVSVIGEIGDHSNLPLLRKELSHPRNFRKGQSLWIRHQIEEVIASLEQQ